MKPGVVWACGVAVFGVLAGGTRPAFGHGESVRGVGGVGVNTIGGEVAEGVAVSLRYDLRSYGLFTEQELLAFQRQGENVHQHAREHTALLGVTVPLAPRWDLSVLLQANRFEDFLDNGDRYALANNALSRTDVSQGLGDLLLFGRYQLLHVGEHHLAALLGLKLPTGDIRQRTNQGDLVGTHNQPGSGSADFQFGAAYSGRFLGRLLVSADVLARVNTEGAGSFRSGNSLQADVAFGVSLGRFLVPSVELNAFFQERDIEQDAVKTNSGVSSLFITPGVRLAFGAHSFFVAGSLPLWQSFQGVSNNEQFRVSAGYAFSFGHGHDHETMPPQVRPVPRP